MDAKVMLETRVRLSHRAGGLAFCRENPMEYAAPKDFPQSLLRDGNLSYVGKSWFERLFDGFS